MQHNTNNTLTTTEYPQESKRQIPLSERPGFIALPSDPSVKLTEAQLNDLFPPANRVQFIRDLARIAQQRAAKSEGVA